MKSKQRNERAMAKAFLRNSGSEFPPHRRDQAIAQRYGRTSKHAAARGKEEGPPPEIIEGIVRDSIEDAYRLIAVIDCHINESTSLMIRHRRNAGRQT